MGLLRGAWFVGSRVLLYTLRQKETILWTFVMPLVFFYFIGSVTGGMKGGGGERKVTLALRVPVDAGFLADEIQRRLEEQDFTVLRPDDTPDAKVPLLHESAREITGLRGIIRAAHTHEREQAGTHAPHGLVAHANARARHTLHDGGISFGDATEGR